VAVGVGVAVAIVKSSTDHARSAAAEPVVPRVIWRLVALVRSVVNHPTPGLSSVA
jgi:hypothetical protein